MNDVMTKWLVAGAVALLGVWCAGGALREARRTARRFGAMRRQMLVALGALAVVCCIEAQKRDGGEGNEASRVEHGGEEGLRSGVNVAVTNLRFTAIAKTTNVVLSVAWPTNFLEAETTLDVFTKGNLIGEEWRFLFATNVAASETGFVAEIAAAHPATRTNAADSAFFLVRDRAWCAESMRDADGDGLPDALG